MTTQPDDGDVVELPDDDPNLDLEDVDDDDVDDAEYDNGMDFPEEDDH